MGKMYKVVGWSIDFLIDISFFGVRSSLSGAD